MFFFSGAGSSGRCKLAVPAAPTGISLAAPAVPADVICFQRHRQCVPAVNKSLCFWSSGKPLISWLVPIGGSVVSDGITAGPGQATSS